MTTKMNLPQPAGRFEFGAEDISGSSQCPLERATRLEQTAIEWFATLLRYWGEDKGLGFTRRLAGQNLKIVNGNTLLTQKTR